MVIAKNVKIILFMVFNATFNNISVISWQSVLLVEKTGVPEKTIELSQVIDKLYHIMLTTSLSPIRCGFVHGFVNYKKGAFDSQPQVIKFTSCLPMIGGSLRVLQLLPPVLRLFHVGLFHTSCSPL
jgi:hypothetical protein